MTWPNKFVNTNEKYETTISSTQSLAGLEVQLYMCTTKKVSATTNAKSDQ